MFGELVIAYLFLGGAGGGLCILVGAMTLLVPRERIAARRTLARWRRTRFVLHAPEVYRRLLGPASALATACLIVASLLLTIDLGVTNNVTLLFLFPTPTFVTFGAWSLMGCTLVALLGSLVWTLPTLHVRLSFLRAGAAALIVLGACVAAYTGLMLSTMPAIPFWASPWLPVAFVASSVACGIALFQIVSILIGSSPRFRGLMRRLAIVGGATALVEAAATGMLVATAFASPYQVAKEAASSLVTGALWEPFLLGFGLCGIGGALAHAASSLALRPASGDPGVVRSVPRMGSALTFTALVLIGGFSLRYCIVVAGMHPQVWV